MTAFDGEQARLDLRFTVKIKEDYKRIKRQGRNLASCWGCNYLRSEGYFDGVSHGI